MEDTSDQLSKLSILARDMVMSSAHVAQRLPMTSQGRLTVVISQAFLGDVTLLKEEKAAALASRGLDSSNPAKAAKRHGKLSMDIIRLIINKKKRKFPIKTTFTLPVFGGSTRQLFNDPQVGLNFSQMCVKCACLLEIDHKATATKMNGNEANTVVKAWCSSREVLCDIIDVLTSLARKIQRENSVRWQKKRAVSA